jgi:hypothetical protein
MSKGLWSITTGESYDVRANSEDEAMAIFFVAQGYADKDDYPDFHITDEDIDSVQYTEANTVAEHIQDLS